MTLARYFIFSVLLLLMLVSIYIFFEAKRLQEGLLRETRSKGVALAETMENNIRSVILGNSLLEELISQRLFDNARLVDQLLRFPPVDRAFLERVAALNGLRKIELLDLKGQPYAQDFPAPSPGHMREMMARMGKMPTEESLDQHRSMMTFMWGRRWRLSPETDQPPPAVAQRKFWEGSVFGVAIGARSFPGIIAVHADAQYILNFRQEFDVQKQVRELGRQPDIDHILLADNNFKILAHTDPRLIHQPVNDTLLTQIKAEAHTGGQWVRESESGSHYDVVKTVTVNGAPIGFLEIGLSLKSMETAWRRSLRNMVVFGLAILAVGILGMGAIFYTQQGHLSRVKTLEAEIARQERLSELGNLAATVAHEIRNPLNSVSMGLQRLKAEFSPAADKVEYDHFLELMQAEVRRLNAIVEQFLSLARPLDLKREDIAVREFLTGLITLAAGDAKTSHVEIDLKMTPDLPPLWADVNYLKQLLLNLILNGVQAMPRGGTLTVAAEKDKNFLRLTVIDIGPGIEPEALENIFEPYFTTKPNGSGLGLAIARRIVEAHGGKITAHNVPQGGACFEVLLPLGKSEA